jgi:hypothetical protein
MILNELDVCPMPAARALFAAVVSVSANVFFLWALQQGGDVLRWLPGA